jgi:2-dehydropantoate 2-reductase
MKVSVLGAGAVGGMLGGLIKHHDPGIDMRFIACGPHGDAMRRTGQVVLKGPWGTRTVPVSASEDLAEIAGSDYIFLLVKAQFNDDILRRAGPLLDGAVLLTLQNGIHWHALGEFFPPERLLAGMTLNNMAVIEPGVVGLERSGVTIVGPRGPEVPPAVAEGAVALLQKTGLDVRPSANILGVQYNKLLINTVGYASVLSDSDFIADCVLCRAWRRAVAVPLLTEGLDVVARAAVRLERSEGAADVFPFRRLLRLLDIWPTDRVVRFFLTRVVKPRRIVYSVYQDLARGDKTEIDFVNGEIVRLAAEQGRKAPYNALVAAMVHELEARGKGTFFTRDEVVSRFRGLAQTGAHR